MRNNSMKAIAIIITIILICVNMTSCLDFFDSLLETELTEKDTEEQTSAFSNNNPRIEKDSYDLSNKLDCQIAGVLLKIPDYCSLGDNSKDDMRWYYAERNGKTAYFNIFKWPGNDYSQKEFEDDITSNNLQNMYLEMVFSDDSFENTELLNTEFITVCDHKSCIFNYKTEFTYSGTTYQQDGSVFFMYNERTDNVLCINLSQTSNTEYTYNNDFRKIVNSISLLSEDEEKTSHNHTYNTTVTVEPNCANSGVKSLTCTVCFDTKQEEIPPTGNHTYTSEVTKQATCKDPGEKKYTCTVCGHEYVESTPVTIVHTYSEWNVSTQATTSSNGLKERTCKVCGYKQTETIPKLYPVTLPKSSLVNNTTKIQKKQNVTVNDYCEFTVESVDITKRVEPPKKSGVYSYYQAYEGQIYVDVCIKYKNILTKKINADDVFDSYLVFSNIYEYRGNIIVEEKGRSDFTYASITDIEPLSSMYLHVLFRASDLIKTINGSLVVVFKIDGKAYSVVVREGSVETVNTTEGYKTKSSGSIEKKEKVALPGKYEFYLESISVSTEVKPPKATGVYFYKKAEEGNKIIDLCFCYKNTSNKSITADDAFKSATLKYNNKYEYSASGFIEEKGRTEFTYLSITNINPLCYEYIHVAFQVPNEVADNAKGSTVTVKINNATYTVLIK